MTKIENGNSSHGNDVDEEFLSFVLGDESYALDIMSVKEIRVTRRSPKLPMHRLSLRAY